LSLDRKRADVLLVERGYCESRAKARAAIEAGKVSANGRRISKPSEQIEADATIVAEAAHPFVGRGGIKLDHALTIWPIETAGRVVLDVGASTGGFTQVCLNRGAARIYAVDVGKGQLHPRLAADGRVVNLEGQDARALDRTLIPEAPSLIVCDASFISLSKVLPAALALAEPEADLVCLVKPQFEAGPEGVGKGGIVRDPMVFVRALDQAQDWLKSQGWSIRGAVESPITGGDGNVEALVWAKK
jgi:23S rRNA (cytidine1920-2'-O)/16S rRNA (cytidine1409-2'-O)-methyltransferase